LSVATPGRVDGNALAGLGESAVEGLLGGVALVGESRVDGLELFARLFGGLFALMGAGSRAWDGLGTLPLITLSSACAVMIFSLGLVTATLADEGAFDSALKVDGATWDVLPGVDVTWSNTTAAPMTPTTIVPKAMGK
jgi:hypothetical protein